MKNIIKTVIVMLTSISLFNSANAGELTVNGTAKATYNIMSGATEVGKGLGVTNELNFKAAGELDNGWSWTYSMELDPADAAASGSANNDDTALTVTTPYGTVGVFVLEGGLDLEDAASQSVYARPTDMGDPSATVDNYTIDSYNNIQFHTPADLLPLGLSAKVAHAPGLDTTNNSGNAKGAIVSKNTTNMGNSATEYQVKANPVDGLNIGASFIEFKDPGLATKNDQDPESGSYYATYATGPFSVGYSKAYRNELGNGTIATTAKATLIEFYDQTNYSIAYAATDDLSVSYEMEKSEANYYTAATAEVEQKSSAIQVAYTMGGMTMALSHAKHDNTAYLDDGKQTQTLVAVTMAF
jgi:hypothetical protein